MSMAAARHAIWVSPKAKTPRPPLGWRLRSPGKLVPSVASNLFQGFATVRSIRYLTFQFFPDAKRSIVAGASQRCFVIERYHRYVLVPGPQGASETVARAVEMCASI